MRRNESSKANLGPNNDGILSEFWSERGEYLYLSEKKREREEITAHALVI
jgi:hypothetical protein